jgi:hypothetical protein
LCRSRGSRPDRVPPLHGKAEEFLTSLPTIDCVDRNLGLLIVAFGVGAVVIGLLVASGALGWFGKLPGDIRVRGEGVRFYFPIVSMLVVSVVLTLAVNLLRRFF